MARATKQGEAVVAVLASSAEFRTAQDVHAQLRAGGSPVGLTTVYRHLQALAEAGDLDVVRTEAGELAYRRCASDLHHHHLVCRHCGRTVEVDGPEVEAWADRVGAAAGFVDVDHTVEVVGTCQACISER